MIVPSDRSKEAFKLALAMVITYAIALAMDWEKPFWAGLSVAFCSLATSDRALLAPTILFRSRIRLGRVRPEDVDPATRDYFSKWGNIDLIVYEGKATDWFDHAYFSSNPQVSADLVQLIRYGRAPGETGRPLVPMGAGTWRFPKPVQSEAE